MSLTHMIQIDQTEFSAGNFSRSFHLYWKEHWLVLFVMKTLNVGPKTPEKFKMETWTIAWRGAYILTILLLGCRHFRNHLLKSPIESCSFGCFICGWRQVQLYGISLLLDSMSVKSLLHERSLVKSWNTEKYKIQLLYLKGF